MEKKTEKSQQVVSSAQFSGKQTQWNSVFQHQKANVSVHMFCMNTRAESMSVPLGQMLLVEKCEKAVAYLLLSSIYLSKAPGPGINPKTSFLHMLSTESFYGDLWTL